MQIKSNQKRNIFVQALTGLKKINPYYRCLTTNVSDTWVTYVLPTQFSNLLKIGHFISKFWLMRQTLEIEYEIMVYANGHLY
jgi:hypothetical protein